MNPCTLFAAGLVAALLAPAAVLAEVTVKCERNAGPDASPAFRFKTIPRPCRNDAASDAKFTLVDGRRDPNGGELARLHDGRLPSEEDQPSANVFFAAGTDGGRWQVDLGRVVAVAQVNTYSWHPDSRGPQVYRLYASDGAAAGFEPEPKRGTDPAACGWTLLAQVDSRPSGGEAGGQHGVSIADSNGLLGRFRFLLFEVSRTEDRDAFGNTFYSEIDVMDRDGPAPEPVEAAPAGRGETVEIEGGKYRVTLDFSDTPDLADWVHQQIVPMVQEWYPKLGKTLPSEGFAPPARFSIQFSPDMRGVAATSGTRIRCAAAWFRQNLKGEAKGALFHEMVHVVQQYGRARRTDPGATPPPGWLVEGITDYIRWFLFEPESHGAEIRDLARARYNGNYRITANFLDWVSRNHGADFVPKLNALIREGKYRGEVWKDLTGRAVEELEAAWKADLEKKLAPKN